MTLGSILRGPIVEPSRLRTGWMKLSLPERIKSARRWRSEAAARGDLDAARLFWRWEQEAKHSQTPEVLSEETRREIQPLRPPSEKKEEVSLRHEVGEVALQIQVDPQTPCLSARMLQIVNRLKRRGRLHSFEAKEGEGRIIWRGLLPISERMLHHLLQKSEGVRDWVRLETMGSSKMAG